MSVHVALNRFGLGARPGEAGRIDDPVAWLRDQTVAPPPPLRHEATLLSTREIGGRLLAARGERMRMRDLAQEIHRVDRHAWWETLARTDTPFFHRWLAFFVNHFTVSAGKRPVMPLWGAFIRDALRPRVLGRFGDLVVAATQHPAMLLYLDNARSIGPNSRAARGRRGLNENLAREILELHTLGVHGGYAQADIVALAKVLTGWTAPREVAQLERGTFRFSPRAHEPGSKTVLGESVAEGLAAGEQLLQRLAVHPSTARHLCRKLAAHVVADAPSDRLVDALVRTWTQSSGDLSQVARALVSHPDAWHPAPAKLKSPADLVISTARATGLTEGRVLDNRCTRLGQPIARAPSPAGWHDAEGAWLGPEGMLGRVDLAVWAANKARKQVEDPLALADDVLGPSLHQEQRAHLARAEDSRRGLMLLLASPAFQRR